jgi:hypothetical protein
VVSLDDLQQLNLPMALPQEIMASMVASEVWSALTTSSSFITGTGLKKWRPPTRSCLFTSYKDFFKGQLSLWLYCTVIAEFSALGQKFGKKTKQRICKDFKKRQELSLLLFCSLLSVEPNSGAFLCQ